jgi:hypothetical protein
VATAFTICNDQLEQMGLAPLGLAIEGHTSASPDGHDFSVRVSGLRAMQVRGERASFRTHASPT